MIYKRYSRSAHMRTQHWEGAGQEKLSLQRSALVRRYAGFSDLDTKIYGQKIG